MIKFGTSGFRGVIGDNFTKENTCKLAYALGSLIKKEKITEPIVDIGFDNRFMGEFFAKWAAEVLVAYGVKVNFYTESLPSPALAFMAKKHTFGIVLTASHNPFYYNGIKVFSGGREVPDEYSSKIEKIANSVKYKNIKSVPYESGVESGKITELTRFDEYIKSILSFVNKKSIQEYNPKILFNVMHGNATTAIKDICKRLGLKNYEIMKENLDPYFEHGLPAPYLKNLGEQAKRVQKEKFDIGLALDGDSDRITCIDKSGEIYDCNYILTLLYNYFIEAKGYAGGVAHNTAFTNLLSLVCKAHDKPEYISKVGFKHIAEIFLKSDAFIGGETNGIALKDHLLSKDGVLASFLLIDLISHYKKSFKELLTKLEKEYNFKGKVLEFAYPISLTKKAEITDKVFVKKELPLLDKKLISSSYADGAKYVFENGYWGMIRFSGNENVVRIFAEMEEEKACLEQIAKLEDFIGVKVRQ